MRARPGAGTLLLLLIPALIACNRGGSGGRVAAPPDSPGPNARTVVIDPGARLTGSLYGTSATRGIVIVSPTDDFQAWERVAVVLAQQGFRVLLYRRPARDGDGAARAAGDALRQHGATKVLYIASGAAVADALVAARTDAAGLVVYNPKAGAESPPRGGMPPVPLLALASLADNETNAQARRLYDAAQEPRTLALYPQRTISPALLAGADNSELAAVLSDFLRSAFETLSA